MFLPLRNVSCALAASIPLFTAAGCSLFRAGVPDVPYELAADEPAVVEARLEEAAERFAPPRTVARVERALELALESISGGTEYRGLLLACELCAWLAENHPDPQARLRHARQGAGLGASAVKRRPESAAAHYFHALNLGLLSELEGAGLDRLPLMVEHGREVVRLDETFEHAGGHRFLGFLYLETMDNLIAAVGTLDDALRHAREAVRIAPDYPLNRLLLARALIEDFDEEGARAELEAVVESSAPPQEAQAHSEWVRQARRLLEELD